MPGIELMRWKIASYFERIWWKFYLHKKPSHSYLNWKTNYWENLLNNIPEVELTPQTQCLDAGCGPAGIFILNNKAQFTAIDPLIAFYKQNFPYLNHSTFSNVQFEESYLENYVPAQEFDYVFCLNALNHVKHLDTSIETLVRSMSHATYLVVGVDVHRYTFLEKLFTFVPADILHPHQGVSAFYEQKFLVGKLTLHRSFAHKKGWIFNYQIMVFSKQ